MSMYHAETLPSLRTRPSDITDCSAPNATNWEGRRWIQVVRLDYLSCVLTILSTILVGKRCWEGWMLAGVNSIVICVIGVKTAQFGFVPANLFCLVLCAVNLRTWRKAEP